MHKWPGRMYLFNSVLWVGAAGCVLFSDSDRSNNFKAFAAGLFILNALLYGCSWWVTCRKKVKEVF